MSLQNPEALYLLIPLAFLWFFISNKKTHIESFFSPEVLNEISKGAHAFSLKIRLILLLSAMALMVVALSKPVLPSASIQVKKQLNDLIVAIDMSRSMFADDIYPNRFEFAKNKLLNSLAHVKNTRIAVLGFSNQSFLISPLTNDFLTLKFLIENLNLEGLSLKGTSILSLLQSSADLFAGEGDKSILLLSDGGDNTDFSPAIDYAKNHQLRVYIYDISTQKGATINDEQGVIKDANGNIVIVKSNPNIKTLSAKTAGKYLKYSFKNTDLSDLINATRGIKTQKNTTIKQTQALFYYPVALSLILMLMAFFSLPRRRQ